MQYLLGAKLPEKQGKVDCSGLITTWMRYKGMMSKQEAININASKIYSYNIPIDIKDTDAKDLLYFRPKKGGINHIAVVTAKPSKDAEKFVVDIIDAARGKGVSERTIELVKEGDKRAYNVEGETYYVYPARLKV